MVELSEETLRGIYLILCGTPYNHEHDEVYKKAVPIMNKSHQEILKMGKERGWDNRGEDL